MKYTLYQKFRDSKDDLRYQNISAYSSGTAFFFFLSLVPMVMLICALVPFTPLTRENLLTFAQELFPGQIFPLVESIITEVYERSAGIFSIALITTLWSAGKGVLSLMRGLNAINDVEERRAGLLERFFATLYMMVMLIAMLGSLIVLVFGNRLLQWILSFWPELEVVVNFILNFRFIGIWVVLTLFFGAIYSFVPNKKLVFREQLYGAALAAISWIVFSWGFSLYVEWADFSMYGSLTMIILTMIWMYFCMYIVFIGCWVNHYFQPAFHKRTKKKEAKS